MEIILKQDIKGLGYSSDIVKVKAGYARNYLIPKGMAIAATETNRKILTENLKQKSFKEEKIRKEAETLAKALDGITVRIGAKAADSGKIFGSVNNIQIAEAIKEQFKYDIDRKNVFVDGDHIKEVGTYVAEVNLHKEIKASINFEVFAE
jgi:large subunit ribosomal protein L9